MKIKWKNRVWKRYNFKETDHLLLNALNNSCFDLEQETPTLLRPVLGQAEMSKSLVTMQQGEIS
jgi:hypothetical protein